MGWGKRVPASRKTNSDAGLQYCPHHLGSIVGLLASAHLLAAAPGGMLECDVNPNPLREHLAPIPRQPVDGRIHLPQGPGLGIDLDLSDLKPFIVT